MTQFLKELFQKIWKFFHTISLHFVSNKNQFRLQTFTYYIPAPPPRKSGYREKEFDKIFYSFINAGFEIISFHTQAHNGTQSSGLWVIVIVRATSIKTDPLDLDLQKITNDSSSGINNQNEKELFLKQNEFSYEDSSELIFTKEKNLFDT